MNIEELFEFLDLESGEDFQYFENFADFVECGEDIEHDAICIMLSEIDMQNFAEICESYFYDITENMPQDNVDIYSLLENIKRVLVGLSEVVAAGEEEGADVKLADELNRFRIWYSVESEVECKDIKRGKAYYIPVRDALALYRSEKLTNGEYSYDFGSALEYELEEYIMTYADLADD